MASFIENNMQYVIGSGRSRIPRQPSGANPGLAALVPSKTHATGAAPGTVFFSIMPQPSYTVGGVTYYYAFTSFSGGAEGGVISNDIAASLQETVVSASINVVQLNVYLPHGGYGPGGDPGAIIDAFNEATGAFVNDIFVAVSPDNASNSITHEANYLGVVDTKNVTEKITADNYLTVSALNFDKWLTMPGTGGAGDTISGDVLTAGANTNVVSFAYYRVPPKLKEGHKELVKEIEVVYKVIGDIFKSPKENVEVGQFGDQGDPAYLVNQVVALTSKIAALEGQIAELGQSFIQNRPNVGGTITGEANARG